MANEDGNININTRINTDGIKAGVKKIDSALGNIANAAVPLAGTALAIKKVTDAVKDLTNTYKVQAKAEIQLETAAKNNPYLDSTSVKQLKNYASELQSVSTVGDEQLLPMMAQLASSGRTQAEIQDIMRAALDASASGAVDLNTAVRSLNQSYEGNVGALGRVLPSLKNLSAEELKNGGAVKQVQNAYNGMAQKVAESVGSTEQLANAWGDLKEQIGYSLNQGLIPFQKKLLEIINTIGGDISFRNNYTKGKANISAGTASAEDYQNVIDYNTYQIREALKGKPNARGEDLVELNNLVTSLRNENAQLIEQKRELVKLEKENKEAIRVSNEEAEKNKAKDQKTSEAIAAQDAYKQAIKDAKRNIEIRKAMGEEIEENAEKQEILNAKISAFAEMSTHFSDWKNIWIDNKNVLDDITEAYNEMAKAQKEAFDNEQIEQIKKSLISLSDVVSDNLVSSFNSLSDTFGKSTEAEITHLENQYKMGLMSQEEFYARKDELERESAEKKYKLDMASWAVQISQATANTAMAVSNAWATTTPTYLAPAMAAIAGVSGAAQIASIIAAKPVKKFEHGGIVPGNSLSGDHVPILANSREMVLDMRKQQNLLNMLDRGSMGGGASVVMPVTINNNSNSRVSSKIDARGMTIAIDEVVNNSMQKGSYTKSMQIAEAKSTGARIV